MVNKEWIDQWSAMSQAAMGSMMRLQQVGANAFDRLAQQQMSLMNEATTEGMKQFESLSQLSSPQDLMSRQAETASVWAEKLMENGRQNMTILTELQSELGQLAEEVLSTSVAGETKSGGKKAA